MEKGGYLYATVPAYSILWSDEDISAGHFRRYTLNEIKETLESAGFKVEFASYIFRFLPIPIFFLRTLPYRLGLSKGKKESSLSRDHGGTSGLTEKLLNLLLQSELKSLASKRRMAFGGSCLIVAKRI